MSYFEDVNSISDLKVETLSLMTFANKIPYVYGYDLVQQIINSLNIANINTLSLEDMINHAMSINEQTTYLSNYQRYVSEVCSYEDIVSRTNIELGEDSSLYIQALNTNKYKITLLGRGKTKNHTKEGPFHKDSLITLTSNSTVMGDVPDEVVNKNYVRASYLATLLQGNVKNRDIQTGVDISAIPTDKLIRFPYVCVFEYNSTRYETIVIDAEDISAEVENFKAMLSLAEPKETIAISKTRFKFFKESVSFNNINGNKKSSTLKKMFYPKFTFVGVIPSVGDTVVINNQSSVIKEVLGNTISVKTPLEDGAGLSVCKLKTKWLTLTRSIFNVYIPNNKALDIEKEKSLFITSVRKLKSKLSSYKVKDCISASLTDKLSKIKKAHLSNNAGHMLYLLEEGRIKDYYNLDESDADKARFIGTTINKIRTTGL